jgi:plastocyanin
MKLRDLASVLVPFGALAACGGDAAPARDPGPVPAAVVRSDAAVPAGTIRGVALYAGTPPKRAAISTAGVSGCGHETPLLREDVIVENGRLANVFVFVKEGAGASSSAPPPSEPVVLDQKGCTYIPHVLGVRVGQVLRIRNSDPLSHNVNAKPSRAKNPRFNRTHVEGAPDIEVVFEQAESSVPFGCDVHPWMGAWVHAVDTPYFAVSGADGSFEIPGLPPGRHRLEAIHERAGRASFEVDLDAAAGARVELALRVSGPK